MAPRDPTSAYRGEAPSCRGVHDDLATLLTAGTFRGVEVGASEAEVRQTVGRPTDVDTRSPPSIWKYGEVELHFAEGVVFLLHLDTWHQGIRRSDVERLLTDRGITHAPYAPLTFDGQDAVKAVSGAVLIFDSDDVLWSVGVSRLR